MLGFVIVVLLCSDDYFGKVQASVVGKSNDRCVAMMHAAFLCMI